MTGDEAMRPFRFTIGDMMRLVLVTAVLLFVVRSKPDALNGIIVGGVVVLFLHVVWFVWLPNWILQGRVCRARPRWQRTLLEWVIATPSLLGGNIRDAAVMALAHLHQREGRGDEAERLLRRALARRMEPPDESMFRHHLADLLGARGACDEAEAQRRLANECLLGQVGSPVDLIARGQALQRECRYDEAFAAYREALAALDVSVIFFSRRDLRRTLLMLMAPAALECGRPEDALHCARKALSLKVRGPMRLGLHRLAASAAGELGEFDLAEEHAREACRLAEAAGPSRALGESLALRGVITLRGGDLPAAEALGAQARERSESGSHLWALEAQLLLHRGRFRDAAAVFARFRGPLPKDGPPVLNERVAASGMIHQGFCLARAGAFGEVAALLAEPNTLIDADRRLAGWRDALRVLVWAGLGQEGEHPAQARVEAIAESDGPDRRSRKAALTVLATVAELRGRHDEAAGFWRKILDLPCHPIDRPRALYQLGVCLLVLDEPDAARAAFREAAESGIDTIDARQARDRLDELAPV
jgi:tetratricopeptide (TPR) repeat protein